MKSNRFWAAVLGGVLLISASATLALRQTPKSVAQVYQDGVLIESLDLSTVTGPYSFRVENNAGYNIISVERGRICVSDANCPDKLCVRQGHAIGSMPVVCLPHGLVIRLEGGDLTDIDAVVG